MATPLTSHSFHSCFSYTTYNKFSSCFGYIINNKCPGYFDYTTNNKLPGCLCYSNKNKFPSCFGCIITTYSLVVLATPLTMISFSCFGYKTNYQFSSSLALKFHPFLVLLVTPLTTNCLIVLATPLTTNSLVVLAI